MQLEKGCTRRNFIRAVGAGLLGLGLAGCRSGLSRGPENPGKKPNVLLFLVDDMGWMDSTVYGSKYYRTPNMERLAARGMMFTNAYAANPLCSPTRASLMTGKYPGRLNLTLPSGHLLPDPDRPPLDKSAASWQKVVTPNTRHFLPLKEYTLGEAFQDNGYETVFIGKWHLGHEAWWPDKNGFDINIAGEQYAGPPSYFSPYHFKTMENGPDGEYLTERLTDEALLYLRKPRRKPYFLCFWHYAVHAPFQAKKELAQQYEDVKDSRGKQGSPTMAAMIEAMDKSLGRLLDYLDETGQSQDTIIAFMSDNGGNMYDNVDGTTPTNNAPLRSGKGNIHEGGVREPCIFVWPGVVQGGSRSDAIISSVDFYPTLLEMAGLRVPEKQTLDGISLAPLLREGRPLQRDGIFCHFPHYIVATLNLPATSVRQGPWKLIRFYGEGPGQTDKCVLYNLEEDIGETTDLAEAMPEKARELNDLITRHLKETGSVVPEPNPAYVPGNPHPSFLPPPPALGGWEPRGCVLSAKEGQLHVLSTGGDPFIMSEKFSSLQSPITVEFSMASNSTGMGQIFWTHGKVPYSSQRVLLFQITHDDQFHRYRVQIPEGYPVDAVRIDPAQTKGLVRIEEVRVRDSSGKVIKAWDFQDVKPSRERKQQAPLRMWP